MSVPAMMMSLSAFFLHGGVIEESGISLMSLEELSLGENRGPTSYISNGGILEVASLLEASLLETQLDGSYCF
jgi:hypothetical protein